MILTEDDIQSFLDDPGTKDISPLVFKPSVMLSAMSNGKIVRLWDCYGWNEFYRHDELLALIQARGLIPSLNKIYWLNDIEAIEVEEGGF